MVADLDDWTALHKPASEDGLTNELTTQLPVYGKDMLEVSPEIINVLIAIFHNNGHYH